ncbi:MAG: asparagine synthase [Halioglobus sp.]|nr:asparagine synthase [Halioglobus sp.]
MAQGGDRDNNAHQGLRRHGVIGWYGAQSGPDDTASALRTGLPCASRQGPGFAIAGTGSTCDLPGGGAVAVAGSPRFLDAELAQLAAAEGCAQALARGYAEQDSGIFARLAGAFACCIVDTAQQRLLAAIDRSGQHALHYRVDDRGIAFGPEAGAAMRCAEGAPALQAQGVYNYVYFHMVPAPGTVFDKLRKLPAAHYLEFSGGSCRVVNYWCPRFQAGEKSFDSLGEELRELLRCAVRNSLPREGAYGAFLSGGLDSSTVVGVMSEVADAGAQAYAIGFSAEGYDEMAYARTTAKHFGVHLNEYYVTPEDVVDALPLIATSYDEPFGNSSALPAYFCARMAADNGVTTLLAGDGGDELFAGNERYLRQEVFEHYQRLPGFLRRGMLEALLRHLPRSLPLVAKANSYIDQANTPLPDRLQSYNFLHRHAAEEMFSADLLAQVDRGEPLALLRDIYNRPAGADDLDRMLYLDWQITLADNDLRKVSHMCAVAGVDVTYPMLDDGLIEFSTRVPPRWKIRDSDLRHFYKQSLRGWLPDATISKTKQGFGLPFGVWMRTYRPLQELAYDNLLKLKARGFIRPEFIDQAIQMHQSEHAAYYGELVWIFTVFELWMSANEDKDATWTA